MEFSITRLSNKPVWILDCQHLIFKVVAADILDMDNGNDMSIFLDVIIKGGIRKVVIDMKNVEFIDSFGIGIIIHAVKMMLERFQCGGYLSLPYTINSLLLY